MYCLIGKCPFKRNTIPGRIQADPGGPGRPENGVRRTPIRAGALPDGVGEDLQALLGQVPGDDQRRQETGHVVVMAADLDEKAVLVAERPDGLGQIGSRGLRRLVLDELHPEHEAEAPGLADDGRILLQFLEPAQHPFPEPGRVAGQVRPVHEIQGGGAGRVGGDVAAEGADMLAGRERVQLFLVGDARDGEPGAAERLAHDADVGDGARMLEGEHPPRAAESRLDLVDDEKDLMPAAGLAQTRQELPGRDDGPALALDGLDDDRGRPAHSGVRVVEDVLDESGAFEVARPGLPAEGAPVAIGVGEEMDLAEQGEESLPEPASARQRERAGGHPVVRPFEGDHAGPAGVELGQLHGRLDGVRAGRAAEETAGRAPRGSRRWSFSTSARRGGLGMSRVWVRSSIWALAAAMTSGLAWPKFMTPAPPKKSM